MWSVDLLFKDLGAIGEKALIIGANETLKTGLPEGIQPCNMKNMETFNEEYVRNIVHRTGTPQSASK